jgi:hypothetical protein
LSSPNKQGGVREAGGRGNKRKGRGTERPGRGKKRPARGKKRPARGTEEARKRKGGVRAVLEQWPASF